MFGLDEPEVVPKAKEGEALPSGFWNMPSSFIEDPQIQVMYTSLYQKLLDENPDADTIEKMMIERAAALYAYMRFLEKGDGYRNNLDYRQLTALWNAMAKDLRKTRTVNFDEAKIREEYADKYIRLVDAALAGFSIEVASTVRRRVSLALEREG